jgi:hypothetical protein
VPESLRSIHTTINKRSEKPRSGYVSRLIIAVAIALFFTPNCLFFVGWKFSACEKVADQCRNFVRMRLEREVPRVEEMNVRTRNVASKRLGPLRQEKWIVLSPCRKERRLVFAEVFLEPWI